MSKFDWEALRDHMMNLDQENVDDFVCEIVKKFIENKKIELSNLSFKDIKKIGNAGLTRFQNSYNSYDAPDEDINFDDLMLIGIVEILYRKYPEVRERFYDGIWSWEV